MLTIVTGNTGKYDQILAQFPRKRQVNQVDLDLSEIQTNILTVISADKCKRAYEQLEQPVLVDDTGIYFDAFDRFPGALTKFLYQGVGLEGIKRLFAGEENTRAFFQCVLSYMDDHLEGPVQFVGETHGTISFDRYNQNEIDHKLPYDLIFIPDGMQQPAALDLVIWNEQHNHRVKAARKFVVWKKGG